MADFEFIHLVTKPSAKICYKFYPSASATTAHLLVFLNGLGLPQVAWGPTIEKLKELRKKAICRLSPTYDRFGQGLTTDRDPQDGEALDPTHGHDCISAVRDLRQMLAQIVQERDAKSRELDGAALIFVAN